MATTMQTLWLSGLISLCVVFVHGKAAELSSSPVGAPAGHVLGAGAVRQDEEPPIHSRGGVTPLGTLYRSNEHDTRMERPSLPAERAKVVVEEIQATRSSVDGFSQLQIRLSVVQFPHPNAEGFRWVVTRAVDDMGAHLKPRERWFPGLSMFGQTLTLELPSRRALVLRELSGIMEVYLPDRDPKAVVDVTGFVGKRELRVLDPTLENNNVMLTLLSEEEFERTQAQQRQATQRHSCQQGPGQVGTGAASRASPNDDSRGYRLVLLLNDPERRVADMRFYTRFGEPIPSTVLKEMAFESENAIQNVLVCMFNDVVPETAIMRVFIMTPKTVVAVPFSLEDVPLP